MTHQPFPQGGDTGEKRMTKLKPCRDCGHLLSPRADACPWCRTHKPAQSLLQRHALMGVLVLATLLYGAINVVVTTAETGARLFSSLIP